MVEMGEVAVPEDDRTVRAHLVIEVAAFLLIAQDAGMGRLVVNAFSVDDEALAEAGVFEHRVFYQYFRTVVRTHVPPLSLLAMRRVQIVCLDLDQSFHLTRHEIPEFAALERQRGSLRIDCVQLVEGVEIKQDSPSLCHHSVRDLEKAGGVWLAEAVPFHEVTQTVRASVLSRGIRLVNAIG